MDADTSVPGSTFYVNGLKPIDGQPVGRIYFPEDSYFGGLSESYSDPDFGMSNGRDLNGDGVIQEDPIDSDSYTILPVRIALQWESSTGKTMSMQVVTFLRGGS